MTSRRVLRAAVVVAAAALSTTALTAGAANALTTTTTQADASCEAAWASGQVYTGGDLASYDGVNYKAKWWTNGDTPGSSAWGPWEELGACGTDTEPTPDPTDTAEPTPDPTDTAEPTPEPTDEPTPEPTTEPTEQPWTSNPDEKCRPDGLYQTPGVDVPYCDVYDTDGREKLPNGLDQRVIGYFTGWRTGVDGTPRYLPGDIPWKDLSHINYAFAHIDSDDTVSVNQDASGNSATDMTWPGVENAQMDDSLPYTGNFNLLNEYKKENPGVKTLISIGGWAETGGHLDADGERVADGGFYTMTQSQDKIDTFADSAVDFIREYGFDGVDIDYEYPTSNSKAGNPDDFDIADANRGVLFKDYVTLLKTLREKLDAASAADGQYYMLTIAAPASGWLLRGMEAYQPVKYLDYVNMMTYDLHGAWNSYVGGLAPLFDDGNDPELSAAGVYNAYSNIGYLNGDWAAHYFRGSLPAGRINLGVPYYTRGWTGVTGGDDGMYGSAPLADQTKCPAGTGPSLGGNTKCGAGAVGIDNIWHDLDGAGAQVPSGVNPIWHVLNLQHGIAGDYLDSYDSPTQIEGTYTHHFDSLTKNEWWWNDETDTLLTGDSDAAIQAKADYVADQGLGGVMIWELAGDYAYDDAKGEYVPGSTLTDAVHATLSDSEPYGASKAEVDMPTRAIDLDVSYSDFALGDNNYPINPKVTFTNNSDVDIPEGSTITFDTATSDTGDLHEQAGWGLTRVGADHSGSNVGGLKGDFYTYELKAPRGGIPAHGSAWTKLSWTLPMTAISNLRVTIGDTTYASLYDLPRGVTVAEPTDGGSDGSGGATDCSGTAAWDATATYSQGDVVSYEGTEYTAKWWTAGDEPGASQWGPWTAGATCS